MLIIIAAGVWAGWALDARYDTETPWFTAAGAMLGVIIATIYTIRNVLNDR
jgi:F0F1-type ATP synthase assembly protein I